MRLPENAIKAAAADWVARRDAGLSHRESTELQAWLAADPRHREALARCESAWGVLDRPYQAGAADDLLTEVGTRVRRRRFRQIGSLVAGLALLFAAGAVWRSRIDSAPDTLLRSAAGTAVVVTPLRQILSDGTVVELNTDARISAAFAATARRVVLQQGEAHFQVAADAARPFVVVVGNIEVRAVGTAFSVQRGQDNVDVLVTEGRVAVERVGAAAGRRAPASGAGKVRTPDDISPAEPERSENARAPAPVLLAAGHRAVLELAASQAASPQVEVVAADAILERLAWRAPRLEFSGTPLEEAVRLLNDQADHAAAAGLPVLRYAIGDPEIGRMRVSGLFRVDHTESFVRLLEHGFGIEAETHDASGAIVLRKAR